MIHQLKSLEELTNTIKEEKALLVYFSHNNCNVCKVLKPKVHDLLKTEFPLMQMYFCNTIETPEIAAQNSVFAVPTLLIFFDGKVFIRKSRNIGIAELKNEIERPYHLMFT